MTDPLGVAVIGAGYWGPNLIRNFMAFPGTDVRWVCDLSAERSERATRNYQSIRLTADLGDALADPAVEAVAIATPVGTHADLAHAAIAAGKSVLIEKPLAPNVAAGERVVQAAEEAGVTLMCDHTFCYTGPVRKIRELVHGGELGDVQYFDSVRINLGLIQHDVDVFWDLAPHDLSILDYILPPDVHPTAVAAHGSDPLGVGQSCVGHLSITLSNGSIAHIHLNWLSPTKIRTTIIGGSKKMLVWDDLQPSQLVSVYDSGVQLDEDMTDVRRRQVLISYRTGDMVAPAVDTREALSLVVEEFADSIRTGRRPLTDGHAGLRVLRTLDAAQRSLAASGAVVPLDPPN